MGLAQFERNCKMPDPQKVSILVHLSRGLLVKRLHCIVEIDWYGTQLSLQLSALITNANMTKLVFAFTILLMCACTTQVQSIIPEGILKLTA